MWYNAYMLSRTQISQEEMGRLTSMLREGPCTREIEKETIKFLEKTQMHMTMYKIPTIASE